MDPCLHNINLRLLTPREYLIPPRWVQFIPIEKCQTPPEIRLRCLVEQVVHLLLRELWCLPQPAARFARQCYF